MGEEPKNASAAKVPPPTQAPDHKARRYDDKDNPTRDEQARFLAYLARLKVIAVRAVKSQVRLVWVGCRGSGAKCERPPRDREACTVHNRSDAQQWSRCVWSLSASALSGRCVGCELYVEPSH